MVVQRMVMMMLVMMTAPVGDVRRCHRRCRNDLLLQLRLEVLRLRRRRRLLRFRIRRLVAQKHFRAEIYGYYDSTDFSKFFWCIFSRVWGVYTCFYLGLTL